MPRKKKSNLGRKSADAQRNQRYRARQEVAADMQVAGAPNQQAPVTNAAPEPTAGPSTAPAERQPLRNISTVRIRPIDADISNVLPLTIDDVVDMGAEEDRIDEAASRPPPPPRGRPRLCAQARPEIEAADWEGLGFWEAGDPLPQFPLRDRQCLALGRMEAPAQA